MTELGRRGRIMSVEAVSVSNEDAKAVRRRLVSLSRPALHSCVSLGHHSSPKILSAFSWASLRAVEGVS